MYLPADQSMKRPYIHERALAWLILAIALAHCGCVRRASSSVVADSTVHEVDEVKKDLETTREVRRGAEDETITVEEFALSPCAPLSEKPLLETGVKKQQPSEGGKPWAPALRRRTVTVKHLSPSVADSSTRLEVATEKRTDAAAQAVSTSTTSSRPSMGCAFTGGLYVALVVAALAGIAFFALKARGLLP